jgi:hypothetical protein
MATRNVPRWHKRDSRWVDSSRRMEPVSNRRCQSVFTEAIRAVLHPEMGVAKPTGGRGRVVKEKLRSAARKLSQKCQASCVLC